MAFNNMANQKNVDPEKVKEKLARLEPQLLALQEELKKTSEKGKRDRLIRKIEDTQGKIKQAKTGERFSRQAKRDLVAYSFIAPNFIGFCVFTLIPIIFAFVLAFAEWDGNNTIKFVALNNFIAAFKNDRFLSSLKNTIIYCIGTVPLTLVCALGLAVILNQKVKCRNFFRTVSFFPYVASLVAVAAVYWYINVCVC